MALLFQMPFGYYYSANGATPIILFLSDLRTNHCQNIFGDYILIDFLTLFGMSEIQEQVPKRVLVDCDEKYLDNSGLRIRKKQIELVV
jgi:hypothetical protein